MLEVKGIVTYAGTKEDRNGKPYGMVNIEGLFCFADAEGLPERGYKIEATVQATQSGEGANRKTSYNLFAWREVDSRNGNGHG